MILADTSAWVESLRATGSATDLRLQAILDEDIELAVTDVVLMEVLAGARDDKDRDVLRRMLYGCEFLAVQGPSDYEQAAEIYRACRRGGETVRKLTDCVIAAVAIRQGAKVLHNDSDYAAIARHTDLRLAA